MDGELPHAARLDSPRSDTAWRDAHLVQHKRLVQDTCKEYETRLC